MGFPSGTVQNTDGGCDNGSFFGTTMTNDHDLSPDSQPHALLRCAPGQAAALWHCVHGKAEL